MNIVLWIIFGGVAGWVASLIVGADSSLGIVGNVVVGIIGAFLGGWIGDQTGIRSGAPGADRPTDFVGFVWAVIGAVILLFILNLLF
ncbi:MAG: transglycosylase associated protein [Parcubacteria group bacterium GW2011_GWA2_43_11]|nr:MAG: transglycosylase associated protein [Parcubacteria group bacterium GW2011_GWC2_42_11]KKS85534.1 MAG: transglycosylase associated protein [Parcubacteria group bacterium GW2011_GWA2_43_11]